MSTITLTIDGVAFSLKPSKAFSSSSINFQPCSSSNGGYTVSLKDFTGVLEVTPIILDTLEEDEDEEETTSGANKDNATPVKLSALPIVSAVKPERKNEFENKSKPSWPLPLAQAMEVDSPSASPAAPPTAPLPTKRKKRKISYSRSSVIVKTAAQRKEEKETTPITSNLTSSKKAKGKKGKKQKEREKNQPTMSQYCVKEEPDDEGEDDFDFEPSTAAKAKRSKSQAGSTTTSGLSSTQEVLTSTQKSDSTVRAEENNELSFNYSTGTQPFSPRGLAPPHPRWGHTTTMIDNDRIIVYGGQCVEEDGEVIMADLIMYDLEKREWEKPLNCDGVPRQWHTSTYIPERQLLIAFGGETSFEMGGKSKTEITDQTMVLDVDMMLWYPPSENGDVPNGRNGHSATLLPGGELVIFGGNKNGRFQSSFAYLDTNSWSWTQPSAQGNAPRPRAFHTATAINNKIVIFGGNDKTEVFDSLCVLERGEGETQGDKTGWRWSNPNALGAGPSARTGHTAVALDDNNILIHGGWDPYAEGEVSKIEHTQ
ncbi:hypothetical protein TL16_g08001 [Triparma laevis f. inornata]|uniref:Uncharacterized protein n=1 Tax=Triparma laevis f. inornata TaxID=1714386 RepID=A0A9W7EIC2_9STRA|nr:hypothetical protein TL16_g08001 [Triparma laevis f. inornata]